MTDTWARRAPWTGIAAAVIALAAGIVGGLDTPSFDASTSDIVNYYDDGAQAFSAVCAALTALLFAFFAATLRSRLRSAESLSNLALIGGALFALGLAIFAGLSITLYDLASSDKHIDPGAIQAVNALNEDMFFPAIVGLAIFYFSTALAILSARAMPRWWGWVTLALAILSILGPIGAAAFLLTLPWTFVAAILLMQDGGTRQTAVGTAPGAAP
jgi:MFS family permease